MVNEIRASDLSGLNKGHGSKFCEGSTPEVGRRSHRPKRCKYKDEDNSLKFLNDKNRQASSHKFRQLTSIISKLL